MRTGKGITCSLCSNPSSASRRVIPCRKGYICTECALYSARELSLKPEWLDQLIARLASDESETSRKAHQDTLERLINWHKGAERDAARLSVTIPLLESLKKALE